MFYSKSLGKSKKKNLSFSKTLNLNHLQSNQKNKNLLSHSLRFQRINNSRLSFVRDPKSQGRISNVEKLSILQQKGISFTRKTHLQNALRNSVVNKKYETKKICEEIDEKRKMLKREFVFKEYSEKGFSEKLNFKAHIFNSSNMNNLPYQKYKKMLRRNQNKKYDKSENEKSKIEQENIQENKENFELNNPKFDSDKCFKKLLNALDLRGKKTIENIKEIKKTINLYENNNLKKKKNCLQNLKTKYTRIQKCIKAESTYKFWRSNRYKGRRNSNNRSVALNKKNNEFLSIINSNKKITFSSLTSNIIEDEKEINLAIEQENHMQTSLQNKLKKIKSDIYILKKKSQFYKKIEKAQQFNEQISSNQLFQQKVFF